MKNILRACSKQIEKKQVDQWIQSAKERILELCSPEEIILFGSSVRNEMYDDSDLDFLLIFATEEDAKAAEKKLYRNIPSFPVPCDFICIDKNIFKKKYEQGGPIWSIYNEGKALLSDAKKK